MAEAAASLFLSLSLFSSVYFLGGFGVPFALFASAPLAIVGLRQGEVYLLGAAGGAMLISGILLGPGAAGAFLFGAAVPAVLIARGLVFGWAPERMVGAAAGIFTVTTFWAVETFSPGGMRAQIAEMVERTIAAYRQAGAPELAVVPLEKQAAFLTDFLYYTSPTSFMWSGALICVFGLLATRHYFSLNPHPAVPASPSLTRWYFPDRWIWVLIAAGVVVLVPGTLTRMVAGNVLGVVALAYALQGWAVMVFVFRARQTHIALQAMFYIMLLMWPVLVVLLGIFGVFDIWMDPRKVRREAKETDPPA